MTNIFKYHTMKTQLHYSSVKPVRPVKTFQVYVLAAISYFLFAAMLFAMAFGKDLLTVLK